MLPQNISPNNQIFNTICPIYLNIKWNHLYEEIVVVVVVVDDNE